LEGYRDRQSISPEGHGQRKIHNPNAREMEKSRSSTETKQKNISSNRICDATYQGVKGCL